VQIVWFKERTNT